MNSLSSVKVWIWSVVIVTGLTGTAFAQHRHGGGGHHSGGSMHHGGGSSHHHHGYSGGSSSFRFGFGGYGYPGYGYGYGGSPYGSGYGSGYGLRIYSTPRYYDSTPGNVYPSYTTPGYSYPSAMIVNSAPSLPVPMFDNGPIVITAPATNDKPIQYSLNGTVFTMKPGQSQKFKHDRDWIVEFDRGNGKGSAQYSLKPSVYKFKNTNDGWELFEANIPQPPADPTPIHSSSAESRTSPFPR